jgi:hypothetical protein
MPVRTVIEQQEELSKRSAQYGQTTCSAGQILLVLNLLKRLSFALVSAGNSPLARQVHRDLALISK